MLVPRPKKSRQSRTREGRSRPRSQAAQRSSVPAAKCSASSCASQDFSPLEQRCSCGGSGGCDRQHREAFGIRASVLCLHAKPGTPSAGRHTNARGPGRRLQRNTKTRCPGKNGARCFDAFHRVLRLRLQQEACETVKRCGHVSVNR